MANASSPAEKTPPVATLALLGVGYMGASLALALRRSGLVGRVLGYDPDPEALRQGLATQVIDEACTAAEAAVVAADIVVIAAPVRAIAHLAHTIAGHVPRSAVILDLGSVKAPIIDEISTLTLATRFVGCHPLAGTEAVGVKGADPNIFAGRACYVCPTPSTENSAVTEVAALWEAVGSTVMRLPAQAHDQLMAAGSHLPHVASFGLALALADARALLLARPPGSYPPTSLRDTTRIAASSPQIWRDIFMANRAHLMPLMDHLIEQIGQLRDAVESGDSARLEELLALAQTVRFDLVKPA